MQTRPWLSELTGPPRRLVDALRMAGPATRAQLVERTGLSRATVSGCVAELVDRGLVAPGDPAGARSTGGRPPELVQLTRRAGVVVGVDLGRTHLRVAVADLSHEIIGEHVARLPVTDLEADEVLDTVVAQTRAALCHADADLLDVVGLVLGLPCPLLEGEGPGQGTVAMSNILPRWSGLAPAAELRERIGVPVVVDNDANLGALAESRWGAGGDSGLLVYLKLATGIGGAIVMNGQLVRGMRGTAGEFGHLTLDPDGDVCPCGNRGCLELAAGGNALLRALRTAVPQVSDLHTLVDCALSGDQACRRLLADAGSQVGLALGGVVNVLNPDRIVLGGELGSAGDLLVEPLRRALARTAIRPAIETLEVVRGSLGERAEALGAVAVALREAERLTA